MDWFEICITVPAEHAEAAAAIVNLAVPYGIYIEDYSDMEEAVSKTGMADCFDEELLKKDKTKAVIHIYVNITDNPFEALEFIKYRLECEKIEYLEAVKKIREEDWANAWKAYFKPVKVGRKIVIVPSWERYEKAENDTLLLIDPGMAFGTGTHETTRLCILLIEKYLKQGDTFLDIGTGSGILSITALLLQAAYATGVDIDEMAVKVAGENAKLNNVHDRSLFVFGNLTDKIKGRFNIVCANIVADVILNLMKDVQNFLEPQGVFIMSGIIDTREEEVVSSLRENGFSVLETRREKGWVAIAAKQEPKSS